MTGEPFSRLRPGAWSWLYDGDRLDQHLTCAVVDVAHLVVTRALQEGDLEVAEEAARTAHLAAPDEHIPLLDLAAAADARGDARTRAAFLSAVVDVGEEEVPADLPERTDEVLRRRGWTGGVAPRAELSVAALLSARRGLASPPARGGRGPSRRGSRWRAAIRGPRW